jgi:hypothetical protein
MRMHSLGANIRVAAADGGLIINRVFWMICGHANVLSKIRHTREPDCHVVQHVPNRSIKRSTPPQMRLRD